MVGRWLIALVLTFAFANVTAAAQTATGDPSNSSTKASQTERSAPAWSRSRMQNATPTGMPEVNPEEVRRSFRAPQAETPQSGQGGGEKAPGARAPGNTQRRPLTWAGKLFFSTPSGDKVCSGQFIRPRVVLTAAHCVRDNVTGRFFRGFNFLLQYYKGRYSHRYGYVCAATKNAWVGSFPEIYRWDYALILTDRASRTGHMGWRAGWKGLYSRAVIAGYPLAISSGEVLQVENGPMVVDGGIVELKQGNRRFTNGSSGGAFIGDYTTANRANYALSVMSFYYSGSPQSSYGPYLGPEFINLLEYVERGCR